MFQQHLSRSISGIGTLLCCFLLALSLLPLMPIGVEAGPAPFEIRLGDAKVFPGDTTVTVPVFISNTSPLSSWEMGLDYDEFLMSLSDVSFVGTASEPHSPVLLTTPLVGPITSVRVEYDTLDPLPSGADQLVALLHFDIIGTPAATNELPIVVFDGETHFNDDPTLVSTVHGGSVTILVGDVIQIGATASNLFDIPSTNPSFAWSTPDVPSFGAMRVPVTLWNETSTVSSFSMGLDYDEFLMCGIDMDQTEVASVTSAPGASYDVTFTEHPTHMEITVTLTNAVLPQDGVEKIVAWLLFVPVEPADAEYEITFKAGFTTMNGNQIDNQLGGSVTTLNEFIRGDSNYDGELNLADSAANIAMQWASGTIYCEAAADANNDGNLDLGDPVFQLNFLFAAGSPAPEAPFPAPGPASLSTLDCLLP